MVNIQIQYLRDAKKLYTDTGLASATPFSAGMDVRACMDEAYIDVAPAERHFFPCGVAFNMQAEQYDTNTEYTIFHNLAGFLYSRSGLGAATGLTVAQGVGVIDADYRGELKVYMLNTSNKTIRVTRGDRIAQIVFQPYLPASFTEVTEMTTSERELGGFGHSGLK